MRPTSPSVASGVSAQLVPDREIPTSCTGWWPHPHACTPNPRKRSNPLDTQLVAHPDVWSVPDFSECGLGCDSCECAMPFAPLGWGEVSQA